MKLFDTLNLALPIVSKNGFAFEPLKQLLIKLCLHSPLSGTGSPEGVVEAPILTFYMDDTGTAGSILYVKRDSDISGDRSQGWILV